VRNSEKGPEEKIPNNQNLRPLVVPSRSSMIWDYRGGGAPSGPNILQEITVCLRRDQWEKLEPYLEGVCESTGGSMTYQATCRRRLKVAWLLRRRPTRKLGITRLR
jgi:hypothetical protein